MTFCILEWTLCGIGNVAIICGILSVAVFVIQCIRFWMKKVDFVFCDGHYVAECFAWALWF